MFFLRPHASVACNATRASCFFSFQSCPRQRFEFFAALESATHTTAGLLFEEPYLWSARLHSVLGQRNDCRTRALRLTDPLFARSPPAVRGPGRLALELLSSERTSTFLLDRRARDWRHVRAPPRRSLAGFEHHVPCHTPSYFLLDPSLYCREIRIRCKEDLRVAAACTTCSGPGFKKLQRPPHAPQKRGWLPPPAAAANGEKGVDTAAPACGADRQRRGRAARAAGAALCRSSPLRIGPSSRRAAALRTTTSHAPALHY